MSKNKLYTLEIIFRNLHRLCTKNKGKKKIQYLQNFVKIFESIYLFCFLFNILIYYIIFFKY